MKLSKPQWRILDEMGGGGVYIWIKGVFGHGFWSGKSWMKNTPRVNIRSVHRLLDLGFVQQTADWRSIEFAISDKGSEHLKEVEGG